MEKEKELMGKDEWYGCKKTENLKILRVDISKLNIT